jgi:hypothetical protein
MLISLGCESEREFSGVWRQACDAVSPCVDGELVYELHLGRYGDGVAGTIVQYVYTEGLDSYVRSNDCGCFLVRGGRATDEQLSVGIAAPDEPGYPDAAQTRADVCVDAPPPPCVNGIFTLSGNDDELNGTLSCEGQPDRVMRMVPDKRSPRRICLAGDES